MSDFTNDYTRKYAIMHRGALVRQQGGRWLPILWFSSRARAMEFGQQYLADGTWQVVMAG